MSVSFMARLARLDATIWATARQYELTGVLPVDDLYQEGLIELDETVKLYPDLPDSVFCRYFRVRLVSKFRNLIRYHLQLCRNWHNTVTICDFDTLEDGAALDPMLRIEDVHLPEELIYPSPEELVCQQQLQQEASQFIRDMQETLDDEASWVFGELLQGEVPEQVKSEFRRVPQHMSVKVLSLIFGWSRSYTWRVLDRVRKQAKVLIERYQSAGSYMLWSEETKVAA